MLLAFPPSQGARTPRRSWHRLQTLAPFAGRGLLPQHPPESVGEMQRRGLSLSVSPSGPTGIQGTAQPHPSPPESTDPPAAVCTFALCLQFGRASHRDAKIPPPFSLLRGGGGGAWPGGVSPGAIPWGAGCWGAPGERSGSRARREPTKQSRVLISHRSHATTFCSGCCPTFQSHTFASDFNGLHHSPKLYLTKRGGSQQAAARNQSNPSPRGLPGHSRILRTLPSCGERWTGSPGCRGMQTHPQPSAPMGGCWGCW